VSGDRFVAIGAFCRTGSGTTPPRSAGEKYYGGPIPWVKSGELRETDIENTEETVTELALKETSLKLVPAGSLLVAMYGATVGRTGILRTQATTNQAICHIIPDDKTADTKYLFHVLQYLQPALVRRGVGGAQPNISQEIIRNIEVPLPPLDEQQRIAAILDQADDLRRKRRQALDRASLLGQSELTELLNRDSYITRELGEICQKITDGTHQAPVWATSGVPFIFVSNVRNQTISLQTDKFVSEETYAELTRRSPIELGVVLYTAVGSYGNAARIETTEKFIFQRHVAHIKPDRKVLDSAFLSYVLEAPDLRRQADKTATGLAQKTVTLEQLKGFSIPVPPSMLSTPSLAASPRSTSSKRTTALTSRSSTRCSPRCSIERSTANFSAVRDAPAARVAVPSPLAGEGSSAFQQQRWVRGHGLEPSPICACWNFCAALSRKGRGHDFERRACGSPLAVFRWLCSLGSVAIW
jgi:type I restriction enzyme S subunit